MKINRTVLFEKAVGHFTLSSKDLGLAPGREMPHSINVEGLGVFELDSEERAVAPNVGERARYRLPGAFVFLYVLDDNAG